MPYLFTCGACGHEAKGWGSSLRRYCSKACQYAAMRRPVTVAMEAYTDRSGDCWIWRAGRTKGGGYGQVVADGKQRRAHRVAWELATGKPVPEGMAVLHTCDNPPCVRNDEQGAYVVNGISYPRWGHLWLGTVGANNTDRNEKRRYTPAYGDRNGSRLHPERLPRGDRHWRSLHPEKVRRGELVPHSKVTDADVRDIRKRYAAGDRIAHIARDYGLAWKTTKAIAMRRSWSHVA